MSEIPKARPYFSERQGRGPLAEPLPFDDAAVGRFRSRGASLDDRRHAVRDLTDVLEAIRGDVKESMLTADEKALWRLQRRRRTSRGRSWKQRSVSATTVDR